MANPAVDKLKDFGLRHGEKVAMGVVAVLFVGCSYLAWSHPTIDLDPDQVKKTAESASANLSKKQDEVQIKQKLEADGIALANFEKAVAARQTGSVDASKYKIARPIVRLEPGAGLIRDMPELIAPTDLYVHAGRGAIRVIVLDKDNKPKLKAEEKSTKAKAAAPKKDESLAELRKRKADESAQKKKAMAIAGANGAVEDDASNASPETLKADDYEQAIRGYRYVTLIGKLDHKKMKELHALAVKTDEADPHYLRLDVERQEQGSDGSWAAWAPVDRQKYLDVKEILTDEDKELAIKSAILTPLVDPLPFLQVGYYVGAHHAALMPKELLAPKTAAASPGAAVGKGRGRSMLGSSGPTSAAGYAASGAGGPGGADYGAGMGGGMGMGEEGDARGGGGGPTGGPAQGDFEKSKDDWLMIRALDFDVKPDASYRYRVRLIVANPNYGWENVNPGVDNKSKELQGPWSATTASVNVPPDVATYAVRKTPAGADPSGQKVEFQVVKWSEDDGLTVVKKFDQSPGQIIGQKQSARVPDPKKANVGTTKQYDFTSRQILADVMGGDRPASAIQGFGTPKFEAPAFALVIRNDGMLVVRDQASDASNGEMQEMAAIYAEIVKEIDIPRKKGASSTMGGAYGGGMGGGMGSGGMGGGGMGEGGPG